jgi:hypothetical protein
MLKKNRQHVTQHDLDVFFSHPSVNLIFLLKISDVTLDHKVFSQEN